MGHFSGTETYWDGYSAWPFFIPKEPHQSQQRTRKVAYFFTLKRTKTGRRNGLLPKPNWTTYIRSDTQRRGIHHDLRRERALMSRYDPCTSSTSTCDPAG